MTALSVALVALGALAYAAHRDRLALERERVEATKPVPPHEELKAEVARMRIDLDAIKAWANPERR